MANSPSGAAEAKKKTKDQVVKDFKVAAERAGVPRFILGFDDEGLVTTHMENISMQSVSRIVIALFGQMCDFEASQGQMSKEYRAAMTEMKNDFLKLIKSYNEKFDAIRNSGKTKSS